MGIRQYLQPVVALRAMPGALRPSAFAWLRHASPEGRTIDGYQTVPPARRRPAGYAGHASPFGFCVAAPRVARRAKRGGGRRDRTADLLHAMQALSQLSYGPLDRPRALGDAR